MNKETEHKLTPNREQSSSLELPRCEGGRPMGQLTDYEKYCQMLAQQQEDEMDETILEDEMKEYQPEGVFVRGH